MPQLVRAAALGVVVCPYMVGQTSNQSSGPIDYVIEHLQRMEKASLPRAFFGSRLQALGPDTLRHVEMSKVAAVGRCGLQITFKITEGVFGIEDTFAAERTDLTVTVALKNAELDGVTPSDATVEMRMMSAARVALKRVFMAGRTASPEPLIKPEESSRTENWYSVPLPAEHSEDARRISRALNRQIAACGGRRDPYSKP